MKYCMNCGTLLEDSHERCIGCGADVTEPGTWSLYPPEMAKQVEIEKKEKKSRNSMIIAMVVVFVLLIASIAAFIIFTVNSTNNPEPEEEQEAVEETAEEPEEEETVETVSEDKAEEKPTTLGPVKIEEAKPEEENNSSAREIKDSKGKYYTVGSVSDAAGTPVFSTLYPEDFSELGSQVNYDICSTRFPETVTYIVGNEDGNVRLTYMSPQHYWHRKSDGKKSRTNERNVKTYTQYYAYNGAQGYIEAMIKDSYSDIKGYKLIDKEEYAPNITSKISDISNKQTIFLTGEIGDYAKIADDTVYAAMAAECEAYIYHYEITSRQNNTIYMDVYVPVIANTLGYVTEYENDKGEVIEWVIPEFIAFEAGNEELHEMYADAFKVFIANSRLTEQFFYTNAAFSKEIEGAIATRKDLAVNPIILDAAKLKSIQSTYKKDADITEFGRGIFEFLNMTPSDCATFSGDRTVNGTADSKVAFYSKEKNKVFISPVEDEYPGDDYAELEYHEGSEATSSDSDSDSSDSE